MLRSQTHYQGLRLEPPTGSACSHPGWATIAWPRLTLQDTGAGTVEPLLDQQRSVPNRGRGPRGSAGFAQHVLRG